ncbi:uncharacterized protein N7479_008292 [Penicillium vulpinum]|uniref:Carrier domain-containing protein n=1 Tax=Penicillium vulpinum TaxID=29845 RepID=A0A1V6RJK5_9EURO|nr:uncharacterized protein N7479_008292 [Penicillium vulpinum]KAJ5961142.1 hypothetical protein N7479_008292 [Penicillium vulpinum]OQE01609.1 hypothetical protein PENVUL_c042G06435 [Penicillium vulpinum]
MSTAFSSETGQRIAHLNHLYEMLLMPECLTTEALLPDFQGQDQIIPCCVESLDFAQQALPVSMDTTELRAQPNTSDTAVLMLTSGSTGRCKAVPLSHGQILAAISGKAWLMPVPKGSSFMSWTGLDHVAGLVEIHLQAIYTRRDQVLVQATDVLMDPAHFLNLIKRHNVASTFAPNFFLARLLAFIQQKDNCKTGHGYLDLSCLRQITSGGEANVTKTCDELSQLLYEKYGAPLDVIVPGFGMTETCAGAIFNNACPHYDVKQGLQFTSLGVCMPGILMRITGEGGEDCLAPSFGVVGDLEVSGEVVFAGYFNNTLDTKLSFTDDGWFKTGDRAFIDQNGCLVLQGRSKDLLIVNGVKYSPSDIERALDEAQISGLAPSSSCCFSSFLSGGNTEQVVIIYSPTYDSEDITSRAQTAAEIAKVSLMLTGCRPQILPLPSSLLQKSSLGKLSRAMIKSTFEQRGYEIHEKDNMDKLVLHRTNKRREPQSTLEYQLLSIFIDALDVAPDEFDVQTSILDLGISSIELIKLKRKIDTKLTCVNIKDIPLIDLMTNTTVHALAEYLEGPEQHVKAYNPVVKLQSHGHKTPLWLAHPGVGEVMVFMNLCKYLTDRPVYALRASGFNEGESPSESIEEIISLYHEAIKTQQPHGPYALAGYSYGGMLAFEIGKVLEANGDQVKFIGSFNLPPHIRTRMSQVNWKMSVLDLCHFLQLVSEDRAAELAHELADVPDERLISEVMVHVNSDRLAELALSSTALTRWARIGLNLHRIAVTYEPSSSVASMDVFFCDPITVVAPSKAVWLEEFLLKWNDFTRAGARFHEVQGTHYTMLSPDNVFSFQKVLRGALEARGI